MKKTLCIISWLAVSACHHEVVPDAQPATHAPTVATQAPAAAAQAPTAAAQAPTAAPPANAVQHEMRLLTAALEAAVRAIGARDVRGLKPELHRVHKAKDATEAALADGSYRLPKNPEQLETFRALDEAFHEQLRPLVIASSHNDVPAAAKALGDILQSCQGCHAVFRP